MPGKKDYIQGLFAERLGGNSFGKDTKIYKFEKIKRAKRSAMEANPTKELLIWVLVNPMKWLIQK